MARISVQSNILNVSPGLVTSGLRPTINNNTLTSYAELRLRELTVCTNFVFYLAATWTKSFQRRNIGPAYLGA